MFQESLIEMNGIADVEIFENLGHPHILYRLISVNSWQFPVLKYSLFGIARNPIRATAPRWAWQTCYGLYQSTYKGDSTHCYRNSHFVTAKNNRNKHCTMCFRVLRNQILDKYCKTANDSERYSGNIPILPNTNPHSWNFDIVSGLCYQTPK